MVFSYMRGPRGAGRAIPAPVPEPAMGGLLSLSLSPWEKIPDRGGPNGAVPRRDLRHVRIFDIPANDSDLHASLIC